MVLIRAPVMALMLLAVGLFDTHTSARPAASRECCRRYTRSELPFYAVKGYSIQTATELCPINAIIFHIRRGKVCADPASDWVMIIINKLRNKAQMVHRKSTQA